MSATRSPRRTAGVAALALCAAGTVGYLAAPGASAGALGTMTVAPSSGQLATTKPIAFTAAAACPGPATKYSATISGGGFPANTALAPETAISAAGQPVVVTLTQSFTEFAAGKGVAATALAGNATVLITCLGPGTAAAGFVPLSLPAGLHPFAEQALTDLGSFGTTLVFSGTGFAVQAAVTPTPTPTVTASPTATASPTVTATPAVTPTATPTPTPTATPSATATATPTATAVPTSTVTPTGTVTPATTASPTPCATTSPAASPTATVSPSSSPSPSASPSVSPSATAKPCTGSPVPSATPGTQLPGTGGDGRQRTLLLLAALALLCGAVLLLGTSGDPARRDAQP